MVTDIATQHDERVRVGGSTNKAAYMSDGMSRAVENIEGAVAEVIECRELTYLQTIDAVEFDLAEIATSIK